MLSIVLYFIGSTFFFFLFAYFIHSYKKNRNRYIFYYALTFLFIFLFLFSNSVPALATNNLSLIAWGNVLANIALFCVIYTCFRVQLVVTDRFFKNNLSVFDLFLFIDALIAISMQIANLKAPTISHYGIIWNLNSVTLAMISLTGFLYGMYWSFLFGRIAYILKEKLLKRRMYMLSANGILMGTASLFLFQNNLEFSLIGAILLLTAGFVSIIVFRITETQATMSENVFAIQA